MHHEHIEQQAFSSNEIVVTAGAQAALRRSGMTQDDLLARHYRGDWGEISEREERSNTVGLSEGTEVMSRFVVREQPLEITTYLGAGVTTIQLANEGERRQTR